MHHAALVKVGSFPAFAAQVTNGCFWTKNLGHNFQDKNGGFCQGQKRPIFVPNCKHNEPTGDIQACHSKPSPFAGAASCSAQTGPS
jgi:hypothetical protein